MIFCDSAPTQLLTSHHIFFLHSTLNLSHPGFKLLVELQRRAEQVLLRSQTYHLRDQLHKSTCILQIWRIVPQTWDFGNLTRVLQWLAHHSLHYLKFLFAGCFVPSSSYVNGTSNTISTDFETPFSKLYSSVTSRLSSTPLPTNSSRTTFHSYPPTPLVLWSALKAHAASYL